MATSSDSGAAISSSRCRSHARIESFRVASPPTCPFIDHHARNSWAQRQAPYWCRHAKVNPSASGGRSRPSERRYEGLAGSEHLQLGIHPEFPPKGAPLAPVSQSPAVLLYPLNANPLLPSFY